MAKLTISPENPGFFITFSRPPLGHNLYSHPNVRMVAQAKIGNLNNTIPSGYTGFPETLISNNDPENAAIQIADWIEYFDYNTADNPQYEGAILLQDFVSVNHSGSKIYFDERDALATGLPNYRETLFPKSVFFNTSGVNNLKVWSSGFANRLKQECDGRKLCYPLRIWCDVEDRLIGWNAIRCSGSNTNFYSAGNASGPDVGTFRPSLLDSRANTLFLTDTNKTLTDLWLEEQERSATTFTSGLYVLHNNNYQFFLWHDSLAFSLLTKGIRDGYGNLLKQQFPLTLVGNYDCVSALHNYPYYADNTSKTYGLSAEVQYLDYQCPVLYDPTTARVVGGESLSQTFRNISLEKVQSAYFGSQGKPIAPWLPAPNLSTYGQYIPTIDDLVYIMNESYAQYGVHEWQFFCGLNYNDWDDLEDAIDQHLSFVSSFTVEDSVRNTCMWPEDMWPEDMWPLTQWPICTLILEDIKNCVVCFAADLISFKEFVLDFASQVNIASDVIKILTNTSISIGDIVNTQTEVIKNIIGIISYDNILYASETTTTILTPINLGNIEMSHTDIDKFQVEITDLARNVLLSTEVVSVYNQSSPYCSACGDTGGNCSCH